MLQTIVRFVAILYKYCKVNLWKNVVCRKHISDFYFFEKYVVLFVILNVARQIVFLIICCGVLQFDWKYLKIM